MLYVDDRDLTTHSLIFDDHAGRPAEEPHIVDVRDARGAPRPYASVAGVHVVRSEPLDCLDDVEYFVKAVDAAEAARTTRQGTEE